MRDLADAGPNKRSANRLPGEVILPSCCSGRSATCCEKFFGHGVSQTGTLSMIWWRNTDKEQEHAMELLEPHCGSPRSYEGVGTWRETGKVMLYADYVFRRSTFLPKPLFAWHFKYLVAAYLVPTVATSPALHAFGLSGDHFHKVTSPSTSGVLFPLSFSRTPYDVAILLIVVCVEQPRAGRSTRSTRTWFRSRRVRRTGLQSWLPWRRKSGQQSSVSMDIRIPAADSSSRPGLVRGCDQRDNNSVLRIDNRIIPTSSLS